MDRFFTDNSGLFIPVALIALWLAVSAAARCFRDLLRKVRDFSFAANGRAPASFRNAHANRGI